MDLEKYRAFCAKLSVGSFWAIAASMATNQLTYSVNGKFPEMAASGGFGAVLALLMVTMRSIATVFSVCGVLALIVTVIGLMRKQWAKSALLSYGLIVASLLWAVVSLCHSFDYKTSLFGTDGRDEGWFALLMYGGFFYLGSMLRREEYRTRLLRGLMTLGIANSIWAILQAQPFFDFPNTYKMIEPMLLQNLRLPSGFTDSPITYAMLLAMLLAVSVPAAMLSADKKLRRLALVCAGGAMLTVFKTQTVAGLIAGIGGVLLMLGILIVKKQAITGKKWLTPAVTLCAALLSVGWTCVTPSINGVYNTSTDAPIANGYALYDGGVIWDDAAYRLSVSGTYRPSMSDGLDIYDTAGVLGFCWGEGVRVIGLYPLEGAGPDNYIFTQLHTSMVPASNPNTVDRPYNDLLYIAATRGVVSLLMHLVLLGGCLVLVWRRRTQESWVMLAAGGAVVLYTLSSLVGISVLTVAPVFWVLLGMLAAEPLAEAVKDAPAKKEKKGM